MKAKHVIGVVVVAGAAYLAYRWWKSRQTSAVTYQANPGSPPVALPTPNLNLPPSVVASFTTGVPAPNVSL